MILKKEREVVNLMNRHLYAIEEWVKMASGAVESYINGDISEAESLTLKVKEIKNPAHSIQNDIWEKLCNGAYLPMIRGDLLTIVNSFETIADATKACCDMLLFQQPKIPEKMKNRFFHLAEESFNLIQPIKECALHYLKGDGSINFIKGSVRQFREKEAVVNKIECDLTQEIFNASLDPWNKTQLKNCLEGILKVSVQAGEAAYEMQRIYIKLVT